MACVTAKGPVVTDRLKAGILEESVNDTVLTGC
jgi:hypothetical protein